MIGRPRVLLLVCALAACNEPSVEPAARAADPMRPGVIRGVVELAPALSGPGAGAVEPGRFDCIFIMGWRDPDQRVPDLVRRIDVTDLPSHFALDARDLMDVGSLGGAWTLRARLDSDGDARALAGDVEGRAEGLARAGSGEIRIVLDAIRETSAPIESPAPTEPSGHAHGALHAAGPITADEPRIRGTLELDESFQAREGTGTLFIIVRADTQARGMPRAVLSAGQPRFPFAFDIGPEHVPLDIENKADLLTGELYLSARLDADGDALTRQSDDVTGAPVPVTAGGEPITLMLDTPGSDP